MNKSLQFLSILFLVLLVIIVVKLNIINRDVVDNLILVENIELKLNQEYFAPTDVIQAFLENRTDYTIYNTHTFEIERFSNNQWVRVHRDFQFGQPVTGLYAHESIYFSVDLGLFEIVSSGRYRLVVNVGFENDKGVYAEFYID